MTTNKENQLQAHYLQHVPFEGLGSIEAWLQNAGYRISGTRFFASGELPDIEDIDLLIILGGPMSVNDETDHPWLMKEKAFIKDVIQAGVPTLGICLGAQLIANAMGGSVFPNPVKEIGWFPVQSVQPEDDLLFRFPERMEVFHWHGETFDLPDGACRLAESEGCHNQAFQIGTSAIGLQFHLETTSDSAKAIVANCRNELVAERYIQSEAKILSTPRKKYVAINQLMGSILEYLVTNHDA